MLVLSESGHVNVALVGSALSSLASEVQELLEEFTGNERLLVVEISWRRARKD